MLARGYIAGDDLELFLPTDDEEEAVEFIKAQYDRSTLSQVGWT